MESLNKVMKVANGLRILYTVLFALCIVSVVTCTLCGILFSVMDGMGIWEDPEIVAMIGEFSELGFHFNFGALDLVMYGAAIASLGTTVLYYFVKKFYKYVLSVGDPFDCTVICKMQTVGILYLVIPFVTNIISSFLVTRFITVTGLQLEGSSFVSTPTFVLGVAYILLTFVFSYAADLREGKNAPTPQPAVATEEEKPLSEE